MRIGADRRASRAGAATATMPHSVRERVGRALLRRRSSRRARPACDHAQPAADRARARLCAGGRARLRPRPRSPGRRRRALRASCCMPPRGRRRNGRRRRGSRSARRWRRAALPLVLPWGTERERARSERIAAALAQCPGAGAPAARCRRAADRGSRSSSSASTPGSCTWRRRWACRWSRSSSAASPASPARSAPVRSRSSEAGAGPPSVPEVLAARRRCEASIEHIERCRRIEKPPAEVPPGSGG